MPLRIRDAQMDALEQSSIEDFVSEALAIVSRHWPNTVASRGEDAMCATLRRGVREARAFGLTRRPDVLVYLNATMALGEGFAKDPRYPWATLILTSRRLDADEKVLQLVEQTSAILSGLPLS